MGLAHPIQKFQDWFTQQWVILFGKKINPKEVPWLMGPFRSKGVIGEAFVNTLAQKENLILKRNPESQGLLPSISSLKLSPIEVANLSQNAINFYENTVAYNMDFKVAWNPFFKVFGILVKKLFSHRIHQLNIPTKNINDTTAIKSEIITLSDSKSKKQIYTIWLRTFKSSGQVIYAGVYSTCTLPSGKTCIKAVFPLPNGNATVIMSPSIGKHGELILKATGKKFGDAGFYFNLIDIEGNYWSKFIRSFRDQLIVSSENDSILAKQSLTLWHLKVLHFYYKIQKNETL